jgi:hypothetical protein
MRGPPGTSSRLLTRGSWGWTDNAATASWPAVPLAPDGTWFAGVGVGCNAQQKKKNRIP